MVLRIEDISFIGVYVNDSFRDFKDINDYANYHVSLLNNKRYQAFSGGDFIDSVVKGGYATDPNYKRALSNVYNQIAKAQEGMKIPKLKGAGELRARILRQFNREKAANRNEEQLIGFDWSRYKSNKPKPETTPTQSEQLENGGVIKAQDGIVTQAINKVKSFLPKEEPKEPVDVVDIIKEYAPSAATSFLSGSVNPFINKLLEGKKPSLDYSHKFGSTGNKFEEFASVMTPIFKEALEENGLPITNLNNLVRQAALESNYGLDPRGERGFNLSGIKHPGDSIAPKYKKSRYKDGFDYIDFDNLKDYANYKVKVLNDRYKALDAKDTNDFIDRLHGNNSGGYNYSADKDSYRRNLNGTLSLNKYLKRGGIAKYQNPAQPINRSAIRTDADKNVPKRNRAIYSTFDATWNTPPWYIATAKAARVAYKQMTNPNEMDYIVTDSVADAGWRKRLGLSYDSKFLPSNEDGSVRLPSDIEAEIPVDTTLLKDRIARETKAAESKDIMGKDWQLVTGLINLDKQNLDSLRKTYNTGKPTVLNEYSHNSRNLIENGRLVTGAREYNTPLNILKNYTVQYDSKNRTMNYRDIYDFNGYEWAIPGKKFNIKGSINLDKR